MNDAFSPLEVQILRAKGLSEEQVARLGEVGVSSVADLHTVADATTLRQLLPGLAEDTAGEVMGWALARPAADAAPHPTSPIGPTGPLVIETSDTVYCVHCSTRQPKDYSSGDLCTACGKQAEPILACHWCASSGPGAFCRQCGAEFVPTAELELAILLKREGVAKNEISTSLTKMTAADKDALWSRVRKSRG